MRRCPDRDGIVSWGQGFLDPIDQYDVKCSACGVIGEKVTRDVAEVMAGQHLDGTLGPLSEAGVNRDPR